MTDLMETMRVIARPIRYQMGAEELIELGRAGRGICHGHAPFLANRPQLGRRGDPSLGDIFSDVGGVITGALGFALNTLGDLVDLPLNILSQGVDVAFNGIASLLDNVPIIGAFLGQILLLGNAVIKFALSVPGLLLHGLGGIMMNISKALTAKNTTAENQKNVDKAKDDIVSKAPAAIKGEVKKALEASGVTGSNLTPALDQSGAVPAGAQDSGGLEKVLTIGLPIAGAAAFLFALTRA